ncbi:hypothetical protein [Neoaquamicrobium sediminum]|uniref:hypothetical protein n=1 Tax=Neoaquamicrobium sediminum TaxID=1849104 RepID=UPI003605C122
MTASVTKLPTASASYITVRRGGRLWRVVLETPCGRKQPLRTFLAGFGSAYEAADYARQTANRMHRPLRLPDALSILSASGGGDEIPF